MEKPIWKNMFVNILRIFPQGWEGKSQKKYWRNHLSSVFCSFLFIQQILFTSGSWRVPSSPGKCSPALRSCCARRSCNKWDSRILDPTKYQLSHIFGFSKASKPKKVQNGSQTCFLYTISKLFGPFFSSTKKTTKPNDNPMTPNSTQIIRTPFELRFHRTN